MGIDQGLLKAILDHKDKIAGPHFIFSADNPVYPHKDELKMPHEKVLRHLQGAGYDAHEVHGHYGAPERSIIVYGVTPKQAEKLHGLASRMGQASSIYSTGQEHEMRFHHGESAGKKITGTGTVWHKEKPKDFYTTLPDGYHFTHNFQETPTIETSKIDKEEKIDLVHYSTKPNLTTIDPKYKGTGTDMNVKGRDTWHPHSFYYRAGTQPEEIVAGRAKHKYYTSLNPSKQPIYDIGKDPRGIVKESIHANQGVVNMDDIHDRLKMAGYVGFHNSAHPQLSHVVAVYHPLKVERYEQIK